jgi:hypothetical protein
LAFSPLTGQDPQLPSAKVVEANAAIEMAVTAMVRNFFITRITTRTNRRMFNLFPPV